MAWRSQFEYATPVTLGNWDAGLDSLAGGAAGLSADVISIGSNYFVDVLLEVNIANITDAGNRQVVVYAVPSLDNSTYAEFNASNTFNCVILGALNETGTSAHTKHFSLASAFGGVLPPYVKIGVINDNSTTALASSGNSIRYQGVLAKAVDIG